MCLFISPDVQAMSAFGTNPKSTKMRKGIVLSGPCFAGIAKRHASLPHMDGFAARLRGLCPFRCSLTCDKTQTTDSDLARIHVALPLCGECNLQRAQPLRQQPYSRGFLNFSTIWFTSPIARCLAFSSSVPAIVGGKDQMPDG